MVNASRKTRSRSSTNQKKARSNTSSQQQNTRTHQTSGYHQAQAGSSSKPKAFGTIATGSSMRKSKESIRLWISGLFSHAALQGLAKEQNKLMQTFAKGVVEEYSKDSPGSTPTKRSLWSG